MIYTNAAAFTGPSGFKCIVTAGDSVEPLLTLASETGLEHFDFRVVDVPCGFEQHPLGGGRTGRLGNVQLKTFLFNLQQ